MLYCKGALEMVLPLCKQLQTGSGIAPLTAESGRIFFVPRGNGWQGLASIGLRLA